MRVRAFEIKDRGVAFPPQGAGDFVRAHADAIVVDIVLEILFCLGNHLFQDGAHGTLVPLQHFVHGGDKFIDAETFAVLHHAALGHAQGGDNGVEVGAVPLRQTAVPQDKLQNFLVQLALAVDLDGRDLHALLEQLCSIGRQAARHLAADVRHMAEHGAPSDDAAVDIDWHHGQPVIQVADGAVAEIGIVGQKDIAFLNGAVVTSLETMEEGAELSHDHLAVLIGDHGKGVVLFADARRHSGAEQNRVHLIAGIAQGVLDDIQGDRIQIRLPERRRVGLDNLCWHCLVP